MFVNSLSGRFLLLTIIFVMVAEVLIFAPSVARFREDYLLNRLEHAQIASFSVEAGGGMIEAEHEAEILEDIGVFNVALLRDDVRELVLAREIPEPVHATYDLREAGPLTLINDAFAAMLDPQNRIIRVIGDPGHRAGTQIEVTTESGPLREALIDYGLRILYLSGIIAAITAGLLFLAVQRLLVTPIRRVVSHMSAYAEAPEDSTRIITPTARMHELREAEQALHSLQTELSGALRQRQRLAQLGAALARISHDLRNILATASLFADRMEHSDDPAVARAAADHAAVAGVETPTVFALDGQVLERSRYPGYAALARLARLARCTASAEAPLPSPDADQPYYPATLHLFALKAASAEVRGCLPAAN